ncbi:hypothetical protein ALT785_660077 [Alteromonas infernus]
MVCSGFGGHSYRWKFYNAKTKAGRNPRLAQKACCAFALPYELNSYRFR